MTSATTARGTRPITEPQKNFISILLQERELELRHRDKITRKLTTMTVDQAKELIAWMKQQPKKQQAVLPPAPVPQAVQPPPVQPPPPLRAQPSGPTLTEGVYAMTQADGSEHLYAVRRHRKSRRNANPGLYVVALTEDSAGRMWNISLHSLRNAAGLRKLTVEETMNISAARHHCQVCGKKLQVDESIAIGIGPVCLGRQQRRMIQSVPPF